MSAIQGPRIFVELTAKDAGFSEFLKTYDRELSSVGSNAQAVWKNTRTEAENYAATLREIQRLASADFSAGRIKGAITPETADRARADARRSLLGSAGVDETAIERYQRRVQELQAAMQAASGSPEEMRRGMAALREEYERSNPLFAQAGRLTQAMLGPSQQYAQVLREIQQLESTRHPLTGGRMVSGETADRAVVDARIGFLGSLGVEEETALLKRSRAIEDASAALRDGRTELRQYREAVRNANAEYERGSPAMRAYNATISQEAALLERLKSPMDRYKADLAILKQMHESGRLETDRYNAAAKTLSTDLAQGRYGGGASGKLFGMDRSQMAQLSYGVQDFAQVLNQGLGPALRASANNIGTFFSAFGGVAGAVAGAAATIGGIWLASLMEQDSAAEKTKQSVDRLKEGFEKLSDAVRIAKEEAAFQFDFQRAGGVELRGQREATQRQRDDIEAETVATKAKMDALNKQLADERAKRDAGQSGGGSLLRGLFGMRLGDTEEMKTIREEIRKTDIEIQKLEMEQRRMRERAGRIMGAIAKSGTHPDNLPPGEGIGMLRPGGPPPSDLPGDTFDDLAKAMGLPQEGPSDIEKGRAEAARRAQERAREELRQAEMERRFGGAQGGTRFASIMEELEKRSRDIRSGMTDANGNLTGQGKQAMGQVQAAAASQLGALQRELEKGQENRREKAAFVGIEDLSKQIQLGAIETKAEKYQRETAENTKKLITEIQKTTSALKSGATFQSGGP